MWKVWVWMLLCVSSSAAEVLPLCQLCSCTAQEYRLLINCSSEDTVGQLTTLSWPPMSGDVVVDFQRSQWRALQPLPPTVQDHLVALHIAHNLIEEVRFDGFAKLALLDIRGNLLEKIDRKSFRRLGELRELDASKNKIAQIERDAFNDNRQLTHLNLSGNALAEIPGDVFRSLNSLQQLDLSHNRLKALPSTLSSMHSLTVLSLRHNELSMLPPHWQGNTELVTLDLSHNALNQSNEVFTMAHLQILDLDNNAITSLPSNGSKSLRILRLAHNKLREIPELVTASELPLLEQIYLNNNDIETLEFQHSHQPFQTLQHVDLSGNHIADIGLSSFQGLQVTSTRCLTVNLSRNAITGIHDRAFKHLNMCHLDVSHNKLSVLPDQLLPRAATLDLQHNPWVCDCHMQWTLTKLVPGLYTTRPDLLQDLRCHAPKWVQGKQFVFWLGREEAVFCKSPSATYYTASDGTVYEIWTVSLIFCIILSCLILVLLLILIVLLYNRWRTRCLQAATRAARTPPSRVKSRPFYQEIRESKDNKDNVKSSLF